MKSVHYYKDRFIEAGAGVVPLEERGFNFGDGLYELVRFYHGVPLGWDAHSRRLENGARSIRLRLPIGLTALRAIADEAVARVGEACVDVYYQITRGEAPRLHPFPDCEACLALIAKPGRLFSDRLREEGVDVILLPDERWANCHIKSLNLLPNLLAKQAALDAGAFEALLHREGRVNEGSTCNVFARVDGAWVTPPADNRILHGVTRGLVIEAAEVSGVAVIQRSLTLDELGRADEVFITSTTMEIMPVRSLGGKALPSGGMGEHTRRLYQVFREHCSLAESSVSAS